MTGRASLTPLCGNRPCLYANSDVRAPSNCQASRHFLLHLDGTSIARGQHAARSSGKSSGSQVCLQLCDLEKPGSTRSLETRHSRKLTPSTSADFVISVVSMLILNRFPAFFISTGG